MRVGVIGAGWIAGAHLATLRALAEVEVVAVCDVDEARAREAGGSAPAYTDWSELIAREAPDALFVCTPPLAHRDVTVAALEQVIHVYLEKPIARGLEDARAIVDAAERSDAVCAVGYQWRAVDVLADLRDALQGQEVGLLIGISTGPTQSRPWFLDRSQGGGNLLERASHQIDLERVVGGEVVAVQAAASTVALGQGQGERGDIDDAAPLPFSSRTAGLGRSRSPGPETVFLARTRWTFSQANRRCTSSSTRSSRCWDSRAGSRSRRAREHPLQRSVARFVTAARDGDGESVFCSPVDAARTLAVAIACEEALAGGGTVDVAGV